jgi:HrpA-like RNA helicase
MICENMYSIVVGAAGSGKTTQIPQIIFDHAISRGHGADIDIICTHPNEAETISAAERVAVGCNEQLGDSVGYHTQFDVKLPKDSRGIKYCTASVLLQALTLNPDRVMDTASHIIFDETQLRGITVDLLMARLKTWIDSRRQAKKSFPKVVLLTTTVSIKKLANYFGTVQHDGTLDPCPFFHVPEPGGRYSVKEFYLDEVMPILTSRYSTEALHALESESTTANYLDREKTIVATTLSTPDDSARTRSSTLPNSSTLYQKQSQEDAVIPLALVAITVAHIATTSIDGTIHVILYSHTDIERLAVRLLYSQPLWVNFADSMKFEIIFEDALPVTGEYVFDSGPDAPRKIVISRSVPRAYRKSLDVRHIVDCGQTLEARRVTSAGATLRQSRWISKSTSRQRIRTAAHVPDVNYYFLFSKARYESLRINALPPMCRSDLQPFCLAIKTQSPDASIMEAFTGTIDPPSPESVKASVAKLQSLGALTADEKLTPLGHLLDILPLHPSLGKMILLGIIFRCFDPLLTLAAALPSGPSFFSHSLDYKSKDNQAKIAYSQDSGSDQIALINAVHDARMFHGQPDFSNAMKSSFLRPEVFYSLYRAMMQIEGALIKAGLVPHVRDDERSNFERGHPSLNQNSDKVSLVKALFLQGVRGNLAVRNLSKFSFRTHRKWDNKMNPTSVNARVPFEKGIDFISARSRIYYYRKLLDTRTRGSSLVDTSEISPLVVTLFGAEIEFEGSTVVLDRWLPVKLNDVEHTAQMSKNANVLYEFRRALDDVISRAFSDLLKAKDNYGFLPGDPIRTQFFAALFSVLDQDPGSENIPLFPPHGLTKRVNRSTVIRPWEVFKVEDDYEDQIEDPEPNHKRVPSTAEKLRRRSEKWVL